MLNFGDISSSMLLAFLLIMFRILALLMTAPVLSRSEIPMMIKIGFTGVLSFAFWNTAIQHNQNIIPSNPWLIAIIICFEIMTGLIIGMLINLLFDGLVTFAHIAGIQMGGSASNIFEPSLNTGANPIAILYLYTSLSIFLSLGGFYNLFEIGSKSFELIPLASLSFNYGALATNYLDIFSAIFMTALKLLMPLLAVMTIADIFVALVAKVLPQANIYFLLMPNKLILGMIVISLTLSGLASNLNEYLDSGLLDIFSQLFS